MSGHGVCVEIDGEPGIGKSRFVHEVLAAGAPHGGAGHVRAIRRRPPVLRRPSGVAHRARHRARRERRRGRSGPDEVAGEQAPDWLPYAPLLAASMDAEVPTTEAVDDLGAAYRAGVLRDAAAAVLHAAFTEPLLLVVEDAMWMDEASAQLLARAMQGDRERPWFACLTTRDRAQGLGARLGLRGAVMELAPLDGRAGRAPRRGADRRCPDRPSRVAGAVCPGAGQSAVLARARPRTPRARLARRHPRSTRGSRGGAHRPAAAHGPHTVAPRRRARRSLLAGAVPPSARRDRGTTPPWHRLADFLVADQGDLRFTSRPRAPGGLRRDLPFAQRRELHLRDRAGARARAVSPTVPGSVCSRCTSTAPAIIELAWRYNLLAGQRACDNYATVEATGVLRPRDRQRSRRPDGGRQATSWPRHTRRWPTWRCWPVDTTSLARACAERAGCAVTIAGPGETVPKGRDPPREARQALRRPLVVPRGLGIAGCSTDRDRAVADGTIASRGGMGEHADLAAAVPRGARNGAEARCRTRSPPAIARPRHTPITCSTGR